ncbi:unnamed protein product [Amoebophrya sp. A120]|nr:unnamed protein product [Amoebophrya sp. A120]|eukprot:GSA120T00023975001.1
MSCIRCSIMVPFPMAPLLPTRNERVDQVLHQLLIILLPLYCHLFLFFECDATDDNVCLYHGPVEMKFRPSSRNKVIKIMHACLRRQRYTNIY